jgi:YtkA-like
MTNTVRSSLNLLVAIGGLLATNVAGTSAVKAAAQGDHFELAGKPSVSGGENIVQAGLLDVPDGKRVPDAVIFERKANKGPAGILIMPAPVTVMPAKNGVYSFEVGSGVTGTWALHLAAKVRGEPKAIQGTVNADLVK